MNMTSPIFRLGTSERYSKELNTKIRITNQVAIVIGLAVALPFVFISAIYFRSIVYLPIIAVVTCGLVLALNFYKVFNLARVIISLLPLALATLYNAYLTPTGATSVVAISLIQLSFATIPFVLFDLREKKFLISCATISLIIIAFGQSLLNEALELPIDSEVIRIGYLHYLASLIAVLSLFACLYVLTASNVKAKEESKLLVNQMNENNASLKESENELKHKLEELEIAQKEEQKRNWITQGIAQFNNLLRSNKPTDELLNQIVYDVTKYINANQCWLFLVSDDDANDTTLDLKACYAYDRHKYLEKTVEPGQGLLGQAYLEQEHIYIEEVPDDYVNITSGLGKALPRSVLIMPLIVNKKVEGIFEIASFNKMGNHEITFVQELGEAMASFISVNKINEKTKTLLEQTQQQTEEMRAQEEEMRQNMEELAATQEEMQRKEQEYINRIQELEQEVNSLSAQQV